MGFCKVGGGGGFGIPCLHGAHLMHRFGLVNSKEVHCNTTACKSVIDNDVLPA